MKRITRLLQSLLLCLTIIVSQAPAAIDPKTIAEALDWQSAPTCNKENTLCGGHFAEPATTQNTPNPPPYTTVPVSITATGPMVFSTNGTSSLEGNVVLTQPGRIVEADKAIIYRNAETKKISDIQLIGHVRAREYQKILHGDKADYNVEKNTFTINNGVYRLTQENTSLSVTTPLDAWGTATELHRDEKGVLILKNGTYSTCSPLHPAWQLSTKKMTLDKTKNVGTAKHIVLRFYKVPILYLPYYSFPLSKERKTGFLSPSGGYSNQKGIYFAFPFYWNLASNYDLTTTTNWLTKRGVQIENTFRYLTPHSDGSLYASILPHDRFFQQFRENTLNSYADITPSTTLQPYLTELKNDSDTRGFFEFEDNNTLNKNWNAKISLRYLTDSYYAGDFQSQQLTQNTNQIPSFGQLSYEGEHWSDSFLLQAYETLHPITQFTSAAQNQYMRLPEWDFGANYPQIAKNLNFNLSGQAVDFYYNSAFSPFTYQMPIGTRLHLQPSFSTPFSWSSFYLTPQLTGDMANYFADLPSATASSARPSFDETRTTPLFNIDSGWYFDHNAAFGQNHFISTLEPRLFYLYVPYENQNDYPNFDTQLLPFSVSNLYSLNQFTGFDRIQNANQLTVGLTSHLLRALDASNVLTGQIGIINYFENRKVCLTNDCSPTTPMMSPLTGSVTWNPTPLWSMTSQMAWDFSINQMNNAQVGAQYHLNNDHILLFNYQFTHGDPNTPFDSYGYSTNASLLTLGTIWPFSQHWEGFGYTNLDLSHRYPITQYIGFSYNTCCWAARVIASQNYVGTTSVEGGQIPEPKYNTAYYLQIMLKGLGVASVQNPNTMIGSTLPGFNDPFAQKA